MTLKPGQPARGSTTGRPIMVLLDLLGRRWVLRILWELRDQPLGFRELQKQCDNMSSSVLMRRLEEITATGIAAKDEDEKYRLTGEGLLLLENLQGLNAWAERWSARENKIE